MPSLQQLRHLTTQNPPVVLKIATEMAQVHNAILRGLNTIYLQAPNLQTTTDKSNLLFLTRAWAKWVTDHHRLEEEKMFPGFEKALGIPVMRRDVEQHHAFEGELERLLMYASETEGEEFEGSRLRGLLEGLVEGGFRVHLEGEIESLLSLQEYTSSENEGVEKGKALLKVYKECENEATRQDKVCLIVSPYSIPLTPILFTSHSHLLKQTK